MKMNKKGSFEKFLKIANKSIFAIFAIVRNCLDRFRYLMSSSRALF